MSVKAGATSAVLRDSELDIHRCPFSVALILLFRLLGIQRGEIERYCSIQNTEWEHKLMWWRDIQPAPSLTLSCAPWSSFMPFDITGDSFRVRALRRRPPLSVAMATDSSPLRYA